MTNRRWLLATLLSSSCPVAWAQAPAGAEFQVNSFTTNAQRAPAVASDADGNFVVVWESRSPDPTVGSGRSYSVFSQRFSAAGIPQGGEFQVNSYTTGDQRYPAVASDSNGDFVVVWSSSVQDGGSYGVFGQRFNAAGLPQGSEFQVNSYTTGDQLGAAVASDVSGNFVVVWRSRDQDGSGWGVFGQRFNAAGLPQGSEFQVNSYTTSLQQGPAVSSAANGNFVVAWQSHGQDGSGYGVFGQRFNAAGLPQGSEFQVNSYTTGWQYGPAVASDANGSFVVVWHSYGQDGSGYGVFGQRFNASGLPQGSEFQVNSYTTGFQRKPAVGSDAYGNFVVAWASDGQDGSGFGLFGQRFNALGLPQGAEFPVNSYTTGWQYGPALASGANGNFVVTWESFGQDGNDLGIFGQRYAAAGQAFHPVTPCRAVDTRPAPGMPLVAGVPRTFTLTGTCGIPPTARAVSLNIAVTGATNGGNVRLYPGGTATPTVSTVNFSAGLTRANNAITPLGTNGDVTALLSPAGTVHVIIDVNGYME
jgi:hypothetical protein